MFINGRSRWVVVALMRMKDEVVKHFKSFLAWAKIITGKKLSHLQSDGGGEYGSEEFAAYLKTKGIHHKKTYTYTLQENSILEHMNRMLMDMARAMLHDVNLPSKYWGYAIWHAANLVNITPTQTAEEKLTPEESSQGTSWTSPTTKVWLPGPHTHS
jgi:hypothetical protein